MKSNALTPSAVRRCVSHSATVTKIAANIAPKPIINAVSRWMEPGEILCSDMPWATAWYGERLTLLLPATVKRVDLPDNYFHWDCSVWDCSMWNCGLRDGSTPEAEDATVWLTYYATDEEREQWSLEEGRDPPPRAVPRALAR